MEYHRHFVLNGIFWKVKLVAPNDPALIDRTGARTVATTDPITRTVCLSSQLHGDFLNRVLIHELGHCTMLSFGLVDDIHRMVYPEFWIEAEEWVCNFIADYGVRIFSVAYHILGEDAWLHIPRALEELVA